MTLDSSLAKLDQALTERINVPIKLLTSDYSGFDGGNSENCDLNYRLLANAWIAPWGAQISCLVPPSAIEVLPSGTTKVTLRLPQSRVRHFLSDASVYFTASEKEGTPRFVKAILRLGPDKILQSLDSEFACAIAAIYKRGCCASDLSRYDCLEKSWTLTCPLFFESPLRVLPLFTPNTPLPEIEFEIEGTSTVLENLQFLIDVTTSPGEADIPPIGADTTAMFLPHAKSIIQQIPSFVTFRESIPTSEAREVSVGITVPNSRLVRVIYLRVKDASCEDNASSIAQVNLIGPPPQLRSMPGFPILGSLCRTHLKSRFGFSSGDKATRIPYSQLPYYVIPFACTPSGHVADYGMVIPDGSQLRVTLHPGIPEGSIIEVCIEFFERAVWNTGL